MITPSAGGALHISTSVELDANLLGIEIATNENSVEQARLLVGLATGFEMLGSLNGPMQIAHIRDELLKLSDASREAVEQMLRELADAYS